MNSQSFANRRSESRSRVFMTGMLVVRDGSYEVRIRDISSKGARLLVDADIAVDSDAILSRHPVFAAGRVTWSKRRELGLFFYRPLSDVDLDLIFNSLRHAQLSSAESKTEAAIA